MNKDNLNSFYQRYNLIKASWYYYIEGLTQQEIANIMGVSRMKINKMLDEARQLNLVQFTIPMHSRSRLDIEKELADRFNLDDVFVVPIAEDENINETLGKAAAIYVNDITKNNSYINMGYGDTLHHFISYLSSITESKISVVSLTGGVTPYLPSKGALNPNVELNLIPSPLFMNTKDSVDNMFKEKSVQEIFSLAELSSVTITGIGEVKDDATVIKSGIITHHEMKKIQLQGAVSDILMHFLDKDGNLISSDIEDRVVSTPLDKLKEMNNVIAVAGGDHKVDAILSGLKTKLFHRLITTEDTARKILERS